MENYSDQNRDRFLSTSGVMETLSISRSTVNRLVKKGLPHVWVGSVRRFPVSEVIAWLKKRELD